MTIILRPDRRLLLAACLIALPANVGYATEGGSQAAPQPPRAFLVTRLPPIDAEAGRGSRGGTAPADNVRLIQHVDELRRAELSRAQVERATAEPGTTDPRLVAEDIPPAEALDPDNRPVREVDLASVLASVAGRNPQVAFARQRYAEAYARLEAARVLWLPSLRGGVSYNKHEGTLQASSGLVEEVSRNSLNAGMGVQSIGAGSPMTPGLWADFRMTDAVFQPRIANRTAAARDAAVAATINDLLLDAALGYLDLLRAVQLRAIAEQTLFHAGELAEMTADYARVGQGTEADADRAATEYSVRRNEMVRAIEEIQVASARLVQLFSGDPQWLLLPSEPALVPIDLVSPDAPLQALLPTGLTNRPELAEARHLVAEAVYRYRREKYAPWLPSALLGVSYGGFGGGQGGDFNLFNDRFDFDAVAFWEVRNMVAGERAARDEARARYQQARFEQVRTMDLVAREIVEAHVQVEARRRQIGISEQAVARATASYERNLLRIRNLEGLPIEVLQSIQALDQARREYLRALVDYNEAQFRLQRALGWPVG